MPETTTNLAEPAQGTPRPCSPITVRPATPADASAIAALLASIGWFAAYAQGDAAQHTARLHSLLACTHGRSLLLVAELPPSEALDAAPARGVCPRLVGYCATHWLPVAVQLGEEAYVSELFVHDSARGTGAGGALLEAATRAARARGCSRIWLVNNRERPSYQRGFYTRQGWTEQPEMARFVLPLS